MPLRLLDVHPQAIRELRIGWRWYAQRSPWTAQRFHAAVVHVMDRIANAAVQGAPFRSTYRWMRVPKFPFVIYYALRDPQPVLIYAVAHTSRRLGYWLRRKAP
jgi:plasmid stabilization system protein ParE